MVRIATDGTPTAAGLRVSLPALALIHTVCQIPATLGAAHLAAESVREAWARSHAIEGLGKWAIQPAIPKIESIFEYVLIVVIAAILVLVLAAYTRFSEKRVIAFSLRHGVALGCYEIACLLPYVLFSSVIAVGLWFMLGMALPAWLLTKHWRPPRSADPIGLAACCVTVGLLWWILFSGAWSADLAFRSLPWDARASVSAIIEQAPDDSEAGEERLRIVVPGRYACAPEPEAVARPSACLLLPRSAFSSPREALLLFPPGRGLVYDWDRERLVADRQLRQKQLALIGATWKLAPDDPVLTGFVNLTAEVSRGVKRTNKDDEPDDLAGPGASSNELLRGHASLFLPAVERSADRAIMRSRYGEGLNQSLGWLLNHFAAPAFQSYYTLYWAALGVYLAVLGSAVFWVTRSAWAGIAGAALATGALLAVGYGGLRTTPASNPLLHFPDVLCLLAIALDGRSRSLGSGLLRAVAVGLLVWWNFEFGLFMLAGSVGWLVLESAAGERRWRDGLRQIGVELTVAGVVAAWQGFAPLDDLARYALLGPNTPMTGWARVVAWAAFWTLSFGAIAWWVGFRGGARADRLSRSLTSMAGVGTLYAALASVHALWNPGSERTAVVLLLVVVPFVAAISWVARSGAAGDEKLGWITRYVAVASIVVVSAATVVAQRSFAEFNRGFEDGQSFEWRFAGLSGRSSIDPAVMRENIALLDRHQPSGPLVLLSRHDSALRIVTGRSGALPYADLPGALISWRMIDKAAEEILRTEAPSLFVDRDVFAIREAEVQVRKGSPEPVSASRVGSLAALGHLVRRIAHCYTPGEIAGSLQLWHRTCQVGMR